MSQSEWRCETHRMILPLGQACPECEKAKLAARWCEKHNMRFTEDPDAHCPLCELEAQAVAERWSEPVGRYINSGNPEFDSMLVHMAETHRRKNHDYGRPEKKEFYSNFKDSLAFDVPMWKGILIRMSDKWARIQRLSTRDPMVVGESIEDTLEDLAVYSILCILVRRHERGTVEKPAKT